jgi:hypothetical protein
MNASEAAQHLGECFDEDGIVYGIGGAIALGVWGAPRTTIDVDVSTFVPRDQLPRVLDSLERAGVVVNRADAARDVDRIGLFTGRLGRIVIDVFVSAHPQHDAMKRRLRRVTAANGRAYSFITAEDLSVHKLVFGRAKDITDLENLFAANPELDIAYVRSWLVQMVPANDRRLGVIDDLERRFLKRP